jgi:hypothetical protein
VQQLVAAAGNNLAVRLAATSETDRLIDIAVWTVLGRAPDGDEQAHLAEWFESRKHDRPGACSQLVWALLTAAEFRFNH